MRLLSSRPVFVLQNKWFIVCLLWTLTRTYTISETQLAGVDTFITCVVYLHGCGSDCSESIRCIGWSFDVSAVSHCNAAHTSLFHTRCQTQTSQKRHDIQPALSTLWTITYLRFLNYDMGQMEVPDDWWIAQAGRRKNEKLWNFLVFFFPLQSCREGQRTDGRFRPRTVNHGVQKQYEFLLNLKKGLLCQSMVIFFGGWSS